MISDGFMLFCTKTPQTPLGSVSQITAGSNDLTSTPNMIGAHSALSGCVAINCTLNF